MYENMLHVEHREFTEEEQSFVSPLGLSYL
jgi:hypothetical protein